MYDGPQPPLQGGDRLQPPSAPKCSACTREVFNEAARILLIEFGIMAENPFVIEGQTTAGGHVAFDAWPRKHGLVQFAQSR